ncbi:hypothetical protein STPH1_7298 [Streptomyces sp. OM5714]|nr:hypothetical protein STPH1_7298 [Streptomyces sp. OM5714]
MVRGHVRLSRRWDPDRTENDGGDFSGDGDAGDRRPRSCLRSEDPDAVDPDPARVVGPLVDGVFGNRGSGLPPSVAMPLDSVVTGGDPGNPCVRADAVLSGVGKTIGICEPVVVHGDLQEVVARARDVVDGSCLCRGRDGKRCRQGEGRQRGADCPSGSLHECSPP